MNELIGTQWVEKDNRFRRVIEVVGITYGSTERVARKTVSFNGKPGHPTRVTYGDAQKFFKNFTRLETEK